MSTFLRDNSGVYPAGYEVSGSNAITRPGISHQYKIDDDIDLSIINPDERVIYNPSEVDVTYAGQVIFPDNYIFKTIRAKYPTAAEVTAAITASNCGSYADARNVPVPTDVSTTADPNDASIYHIKSGSTIVLNTCVQVFDATFDVESGGTLEYLNRSTNCGRWKVTNNGTVIEKNSDPIYLQNKTISQGTYNYESQGIIYAGYNVDPDVSQTDGNYVINAGNVSLISEDGIILQDGFTATTNFYADISSSVPAPFCNMRLKNNQNSGNNSERPNEDVVAVNNAHSQLILSPNPTSGIVHSMLYNPSNLKENYYMSIMNIMGEEVFTLSNLESQISYDLNLSSYPNGIYFVKVWVSTPSGKSGDKVYTEKIIIQ
jgi:hypothetical protein